MVTSIYLAGTEARSGKSAVAVGLLDALARRAGRVGIFRPVAPSQGDVLVDTLLSLLPGERAAASVSGVTYEELHHDPERAMSTIVDRFHEVTRDLDTVLVIGTDFSDVATPTEFSVNARIAANLGAGMVLVVPAADRRVEDVVTSALLAVEAARDSHAQVLGVVANQVPADLVEPMATSVADALGPLSAAVLPEAPLLRAPTVRDLLEACDGRLLHGDAELLDRESMGLVIAAMTMPHVLDRLVEGGVVVVPGDRDEVVLGVLLAHRSATFPSLAGLIVNGNLPLSPQVERLIAGLDVELPVVSAPEGTMATAYRLGAAAGRLAPTAQRKIATAVSLVADHLDPGAFLDGLRPPPGTEDVVTPLMFEHRIVEAARRAGTRIVLPEGTERRILEATQEVVARGIARVTLLGDPDRVQAQAATVGLDLDGIDVVDPLTSPWREPYAQEYARLRAHRGVTMEQAHDVVSDPAYFGTLMVHLGEADGMVAGSVTTTAHTVRPALEVIRTVPGVSVVSSVFFMCLADRVLVYGDCAINPDPTAEQLADIAISSATTAQQFGIEPRVAMLSYSTGSSGTGVDVDKVRAATDIVRERAPELLVEGPIQYDAAVDPAVASTKLHDSPVAGRATVLVFPDLNTGNNTYKAVQRSAAAVAVGPVLQGLNRPVNDLSRGATVRDIVNTVAMTAIQAGIR